MCEFRAVLCKTEVTGYKAAIKNPENGKYYSPVTGIEYKPGLVEAPKFPESFFGFKDVLKPNNSCHIPNYKGMTAVFVTEEGCKRGIFYMLKSRVLLVGGNDFIFRKPQLVMLEMTLEKTEDKDIHTGEYDDEEVYIGPKIKSVKEII